MGIRGSKRCSHNYAVEVGLHGYWITDCIWRRWLHWMVWSLVFILAYLRLGILESVVVCCARALRFDG